MDQAATTVAQWMNDILVWIGFGTIVGLIAKAIMPGRDPGGSLATLFTGIGGTIIGCGTYSFFMGGSRVTPISAAGALVAIAGAFSILFFYKVLAGYIFEEGETSLSLHKLTRRRRSPRRAA
ncbi:GlsB/YeaQ/YmgE family stress response membrane protein [bacterium]|jgi:uncharacterized membrane protein YeaQ/YmgE (transglycosylase-associated protein family)|nr:GlsB/YeaQ/YmgE family stress response membrane protein [bacterium]